MKGTIAGNHNIIAAGRSCRGKTKLMRRLFRNPHLTISKATFTNHG